MVLIYPILTRIVGLENFGQIMVANASAGLFGILVNYGTIQTSIKDVATLKENKELLSEIFYNTLTIRVLIFLVVILILLFSFASVKENYLLYFLALPIVVAEVLNPMFFFIGVERLKILNIANLISKIITLILIIILIKSEDDIIWVNFLIGSVLSVAYFFTLIWAIKIYQLKFILSSKVSLILILKSNFYLLINNFAGHLQQSLMLFSLQHWGTAAWLGAYSLCDKMIWSSRLLIIAIFNSLYPKAAAVFKEDVRVWYKFKNKIKFSVGGLFLIGSLIFFIFPDLIIGIIAGEKNDMAVLYLKQMAIVPFIASLNFMNVLDRLLNNDNYSIFKIAIIILIISSAVSYWLVISKKQEIFGYYAVLIEVSSLLLYEFYVRKGKSYV